MKDISVILTVYNQSFADIAFSLSSLMVQQDVDFEIVVADDGSTIDRTDEIKAFFAEYDFGDYVICRSPINNKTVANVINGANHATGRYLKVLGSGDCLFDNRTLADIVDFCDKECVDIGFGRLLRFACGKLGVDVLEFNAPFNATDYACPHKTGNVELLRHMLASSDWIPGGLQFGKAKTMLDLWKKVSESRILYCEDYAATFALALDMEIDFLDRNLMWYDFTGGVSTSGSKDNVKRMYADCASMFKWVCANNVFGDAFRLPRAIFSIKEFIALKTPIYGFLQSRLSHSYGNKTINDRLNGMLGDCLSIKASHGI